jgi:mannose-6-phosphate isomerase-like protein (cupin superfamily)
MNDLQSDILHELNQEEKEIAQPVKLANGPESAPARLDHWTPANLLEQAVDLRKLAAQGDGSAGVVLKEYPQHFTVLSFRSRDGEAELHENFADIFYILDGQVTLVTGGAIAGLRTVGPGEIRGDAVTGGAQQHLRGGDVAHVPAGVSHQMLMAADQAMTCFVVKIREKS